MRRVIRVDLTGNIFGKLSVFIFCVQSLSACSSWRVSANSQDQMNSERSHLNSAQQPKQGSSLKLELFPGKILNVIPLTGSVRDENLTVGGIEIGSSTLADVEHIFGQAFVAKVGDAGSSVSHICYMFDQGSAIIFSSGELGGSNHVIDSISIHKSIFGLSRNLGCQASTIAPQNTKTTSGLGLHSSILDLNKLSPRPSYADEKIYVWHWQYSKMIDKNSYDVLVSIAAELSDNQIVALHLSKIETY
ncbi:MAG: hypothetical protein NT027_16070 [Proteobacteria bacterium]|nr:hypothetical protein [Pseudomonadota bacterium]